MTSNDDSLDSAAATDRVAAVVSRDVLSTPSKRAVIYLRVSTPKQADTDLDPEGLSLPAQRDACGRRARDLGATIVDEYVDRGESAKFADRPQFQAMLNRIRRDRDVDFVIVDKVNRFARNRRDDANVLFELHVAGSKLISVKENIDDTPAGRLMHGMLAAFAEYESANNGVEALKGMTRKAQVGGTPGRAPLGYINVRQPVPGNPRGLALVEVHPETARHVRWAFEEYATGTWTLAALAEALEDRGLRSLPTGRRPSGAVSKSRLATVLRNPYYVGTVTFRGVQYPGRHEPLVGRDVFDRVQGIMDSRAHAGEKTQRHLHYLKGTIFCGECGSRMTFSRNKGVGGTYDYFKCIGPQKGFECSLGYIRADWLEAQVEQMWTQIQLTTDELAELRRRLIRKLASHHTDSRDQLDNAVKWRTKLDEQRGRLLRAHLDGAVPLDLMKVEQDRITREVAQAEAIIDAIGTDVAEVEATLNTALDLVARAGLNYLNSKPTARRHLNQGFFERICVVREGCTAKLASPFKEMLEVQQAADDDMVDAIQYERSAAAEHNADGGEPSISVQSWNVSGLVRAGGL